MDDNIGLKQHNADPLLSNIKKKAPNKAANEEQKQGGHDTLGFLRKAEEETK